MCLPIHLGGDAEWISGELAHQIEIVRREIEGNAGIADPGRERAEPPRMNLENPAEHSLFETRLKSTDRRIETLHVTDGEWDVGSFCSVDDRDRVANVARDRFLDQNRDPGRD
jgi:hypothetical protein